ncbi:MAG TPA: Uma2 family endonuclease [Mycobacteriales bacterium]|nr:Uma2 family endonuclease [Mycobacteriales bacterium]
MPELTDELERRRELGQDLHDEVWEGVYWVAPGRGTPHAIVDDELAAALRPHAIAAGLTGTGIFNLGEPEDYRVPDHGYHRGVPTGTYVPAAAIVVEIVSPDDRSWEKFGFYAAHGVDEIVIADPEARTVTLWQRKPTGEYDEIPSSALLGVSAHELTETIAWP